MVESSIKMVAGSALSDRKPQGRWKVERCEFKFFQFYRYRVLFVLHMLGSWGFPRCNSHILQLSNQHNFQYSVLARHNTKLNSLHFIKRSESGSDDEPDQEILSQKFDYSSQFWSHHTDVAHGQKKLKTSQRVFSKTDHELTLYLKNPVSVLKSNPLQIWEDMKTVFPNLYKIAQMCLPIVATSVAVPSEPQSQNGFFQKQEPSHVETETDFLAKD